jgi:hypothetical protein
VDIALGVSMAPETVRMVLVEGEGGGGDTVDQADFGVATARPASIRSRAEGLACGLTSSRLS